MVQNVMLSVLLCVCVGFETYVVHYLVGTGLCCAPPTCVHHRPALCTMVYKGDLCPQEVGVAACNIFSFFGGSHGTCINRRFTGAVGDAGGTGGMGAVGAMGTAGSTGAMGATGAEGATGVAGATVAVGAIV